MADTIVRVYDNETRVIIAGTELLEPVLRRGLRVPIGETVGEIEREAGKVLGFDADLEPVMLTQGGADSALRTDLVADSGSSLVAFLQSGTGAAARSTQSKLRDWVSAFDFIPVAKHAGIIAGSNNDDLSGYLQDALDTGIPVWLPWGLCHIASPLASPSGGGLIGFGRNSIIKAVDDFGNVPMIRNETKAPATLGARDAGLLFANFLLDGNKAANSTATEFSAGIQLQAVDGAFISNVWVKDPKGDGLTLMYSFDSPTVHHDIGCSNIHGSIRTENCARQGVALVCAEGCDLYVYDTGTSLFSLDLEADNVDNYIRDNRIRLVSIGAGVAATSSSGGFGVASSSGEVRNNVIEFLVRDSGGVGGTWRNAERLTLRGTVDTCAMAGLIGIDSGDAPSNVTFDCKVKDAGGVGFTGNETAGSTYDGRVLIEDTGDVGATIKNAAGGTMKMRIEGHTGQGLTLVDCDDMEFPGLRVGTGSSHNVWLTGACSGNRFPGLRTEGSTFGYGFIEEDTGNDNRATSARITAGGGGTVSLVGASSSVEMEPLNGSTTWDAASIADGDAESKTLTVTGAALGDFVEVSLSVSLKGCVLIGEVSAANTVKATIANNTGSAQDLDSGTLKVRVRKTY